MTQEEKALLIKDLCGRLPYDVKGKVYAEVTNGNYDITGDMIFFDSPFDVILDEINITSEEIHVSAIGDEDTVDFIEMQQTDGKPYTIDEFKPYLRPLSSMTEEEKKELKSETCPEGTGYFDEQYLICPMSHFGEYIGYDFMSDILNWLNSHLFDYRGLIEKGLALQAPEGMHKISDNTTRNE